VAVAQIDPSLTRDWHAREIVAPPKCRDLADYLKRTRASVALLQTESALRIAVHDLLRQLRADHVIYAEIRFAPLLHTARGLEPERIVEIVSEATDRAAAETGVEARLILCALRHFGAEQSLRTARLVERFRGNGVAALDLAGDEAGFPLDAHIPAFEYAMARDLPRIAHAGEASGPASMWETLERLRPSRIGHGVSSMDDPALVKRLARDQIHLEVCPTCNVQIDLYETLADHPIDRLYRAGVPLSINTDARATTPTTLAQDYAALAVTFGWTRDEFLACNLNAIEASFAPPELKASLARRLRAAYYYSRTS
jgi:adenosine deaminase